jgi:hypothetical protein
VDHYLHAVTKPKLLKEVEAELLAQYETQLLAKEHSGAAALLRDDKVRPARTGPGGAGETRCGRMPRCSGGDHGCWPPPPGRPALTFTLAPPPAARAAPPSQTDDLARMHRLFSRVPKGLDPIADIFREHVDGEGMKLVKEAASAAETKREKEKDAGAGRGSWKGGARGGAQQQG